MHTRSRTGDLAHWVSTPRKSVRCTKTNQPEQPSPMQEITIDREPVELYKILKFEGLVGSGGEAKAAIADGHVKLNNEVETRKRKKVVGGDTLQFGELEFKVILRE
jgi:ribosome-associated protein